VYTQSTVSVPTLVAEQFQFGSVGVGTACNPTPVGVVSVKVIGRDSGSPPAPTVTARV